MTIHIISFQTLLKEKKMKKYYSIIFLFFLTLSACTCLDKPAETIYGNGNTVREFLFEKGKVIPPEITKANKIFSEVRIIYGGRNLKNWNPKENELLWVTGNDPDSQILFLFKLKN